MTGISPKWAVLARLIGLWLPVAAYMAAIFYMSSQSEPIPGLRLAHGTDKLAHAMAYSLLGYLMARATIGTWPNRRPVSMAFLGALAASLYGVSDEIHQSFVPGRVPCVGDVLADAFGAFLGAYVLLFLHGRRRKLIQRLEGRG